MPREKKPIRFDPKARPKLKPSETRVARVVEMTRSATASNVIGYSKPGMKMKNETTKGKLA